ncbi:MAG: MFS transporter [Proteobacteria bacterium]|nr:MFS transporter [Pseudomonadota bacterium]
MTKPNQIAKAQIFYFSFLALPLSFVGIPIYLNISDFYARSFDLNLTIIGILLIFVRGLDAFQDPLVGYFSDKLAKKKISRKKIISIASALLILSFYLVFNPPETLQKSAAIIWFVIALSLTYTCFNFAIINFESLAAILASDNKQRISINSTKELLGLFGMILAFILPTIFVQIFSLDVSQSYLCLSLVFAALIAIAIFIFLPRVKIDLENSSSLKNQRLNFFQILEDKKFLLFLTIFITNSIAVSLPAANLNFYVRDILAAEKNSGWFLSIYFLSACLVIPLWKIFFNRFGIVKTWIVSILGSVLTFFLAYFLTAQNWYYFYLVCFFSGAFLGADLIAPPTILAQITSDKKELTSSYFSLWNFTAKLGLMIAASGSLIILGFFGYQPGNIESQNLNLVSFFYALLPCFLKILVIALLLKWKKYEI